MGGNQEVIAVLCTALTASPMVAGELEKREAEVKDQRPGIHVLARAPDNVVKEQFGTIAERMGQPKPPKKTEPSGDGDGFDDKYGEDKDFKGDTIKYANYLIKNFYIRPTKDVAIKTVDAFSKLKPMTRPLSYIPEIANTYDKKAKDLVSEKNYREALKFFMKSYDIDSNSAALNNHIGICHEKLGDDATALNFYMIAVQMDPFNRIYHGRVGMTLMRLGKYAEALLSISLCIAIDPKSNYRTRYEELRTRCLAQMHSD